MEMIAPADALDWSFDFPQGITGASWSVYPTGGITVASITYDAVTGLATVKVSGNGAPLGNVYEVTCAASLAGGLTDCRTMTYRVGPKAA